MKATNSNGTLIYDDTHPDCLLVYQRNGLKSYAFIRCLDMSQGKVMDIKEYWGEYDESNPQQSIGKILSYGSKWPKLPTSSSSLE